MSFKVEILKHFFFRSLRAVDTVLQSYRLLEKVKKNIINGCLNLKISLEACLEIEHTLLLFEYTLLYSSHFHF